MEEVTMIFSAVLTTLCRDFLYHGVQLTNQREMAGQDTGGENRRGKGVVSSSGTGSAVAEPI